MSEETWSARVNAAAEIIDLVLNSFELRASNDKPEDGYRQAFYPQSSVDYREILAVIDRLNAEIKTPVDS